MLEPKTHLVIDREVETLGTVEDLRVLLTSLADGGGVDDGGAAKSAGDQEKNRSDSQSVEIGLEGRKE